MMSCEDKSPPVVIDNGFCTSKAGFAGENTPRTVFPTLVGHLKAQPVIGVQPKDYYVGYEAQNKREILSLKYPIEYGMATNWDGMEKVWHYIFYDELKIDPEEFPVLLTEPPRTPILNREKMTEVMFETFHTPAVYVAVQGVLALQAGCTTGIVMDSGEGVTHVLLVYEGHHLPYAMDKMDIAGVDLTNYIFKTLQKRGYHLNYPSNQNIIRDIKEKLCYVALDLEQEMDALSKPSDVVTSYELPDGSLVTIGKEKFLCPEAFFKPSILEKESWGIHEILINSINRTSEDIRPELFKNVVISGGSSLFTGLGDRLQKELQTLAPAGANVKVIAPPDRKYSVWIGGSMLASLSTFQDMWMSKNEYDEYGPVLVHKKCF